jgi:hypothetical protein
MTVPLSEAKLKWRKIMSAKEQLEAEFIDLLKDPEATAEEILMVKQMYRGVCITYLDTKELLCITYPQTTKPNASPYPWHVRG